MGERRLIRIELPDAPPPPSTYAEADRRQAIDDLLRGNSFAPAGLGPGPFSLHLMVREGRLVFDIRDADDRPLRAIILVLGPFRRLIKDYLMLVANHEEAVTTGAMDARVQAIDMGRRGLHNEAAELLTLRLEGRIDVDFETARRLFTLVAALHQRV
ncbi:UPF0262 family protein [Roseococcus sp. SYP-B2431]|uniref:UPF0262 family protein n=1 Tax=Roseococcus sp. SYP-B2431 TaxID=2496640 RepID=UPI001038DE3F|nr:UPF0262 family protein [Roseococcus sp. SYP-B2431]TCH97851.1 UPF0262 family protein [Roseococcus sp. SYP-B2431]